MKIILNPVKCILDGRGETLHKAFTTDEAKGFLTIDGINYNFDTNGMTIEVDKINNRDIDGKTYGYGRPDIGGGIRSYQYTIHGRFNDVKKDIIHLNLVLVGPSPVYQLYQSD